MGCSSVFHRYNMFVNRRYLKYFFSKSSSLPFQIRSKKKVISCECCIQVWNSITVWFGLKLCFLCMQKAILYGYTTSKLRLTACYTQMIRILVSYYIFILCSIEWRFHTKKGEQGTYHNLNGIYKAQGSNLISKTLLCIYTP